MYSDQKAATAAGALHMLNWWIWPLNTCLYDIAPDRRRGSTLLLINPGEEIFHYWTESIVLKVDFVPIPEQMIDDRWRKLPPSQTQCKETVRPKKYAVENKPFCEPISVFTHYSQTFVRLGIMCEYSSRWLLRRPVMAGRLRTPLLPETSPKSPRHVSLWRHTSLHIKFSGFQSFSQINSPY